MKQKILFIDRDGTLIEEPADEQIDRFEKLRLLPGVIPALLALSAHGYRLVIVTNQDGLGTDRFPEVDFTGPHELMLDIFASQGISFDAVLIDRHFPEDNAFTRKPNIGLVLDYLKSGTLDLANCFVIGDRETDLELAKNMGVQGLCVGPAGLDWPQIVERILDRDRSARHRRKTAETDIAVQVNLDRPGDNTISTGIGFFDHMLEQLALHGGFSLRLQAAGDLHIDEHHTVEDCALGLGECLRQALGDKYGIGRYGFVLPMDESLAEAAVDLSGRPHCRIDAAFPRDQVGGLSIEMVRHFFHSLAQSLGAAIHLKLSGENTHHMVEAAFKSTGRALRPALARGDQGLPSSKGTL